MQAVSSKHPPGGVCLITGDLTRYAEAMASLMHLRVPPGTVNVWNRGVLIAKGLNDAFQSTLDAVVPAVEDGKPSKDKTVKLEWVWVMGDDHTLDPDCLLRLLDREVDVVAPLCLSRLPPMDPTIIEHHHKPIGRQKYLEDLPTSGLYKLTDTETCGDAGLLVRRRVLEAIPAPWYDKRRSGGLAADDQEFVRRIKDTGFDVYVDLDVQIGHIGSVEFRPVCKNGRWEVRMSGGGNRLIADVIHPPRQSGDYRIAPEAGRLEAAE